MGRFVDNNLDYIKITKSKPKSKDLDADQKRIHWEAYAEETEEEIEQESYKGGEGSGNFGHSGREGEVGGSGEGGGGGIPGERNPSHTAFDNLYNEGGEGYNPHPEYNEGSPSAPSSGQKRDSINRKLNSIDYNDPANTQRIDELRNEYKQSYVDDGWSQSVTQERRQSWNSAVRSGKYTNSAGKITSDGVAKMESDLGFTRGNLGEAVRVHGLK